MTNLTSYLSDPVYTRIRYNDHPGELHGDIRSLPTLRQRYSRWGQTGGEYLEGLLHESRYGKREAQRVLALLHGYPHKDGLAAMQRGIQYHAYGYQSLERILAHFGTPKAAWELLSQREQETLQKLTQSTRVEARRSDEYQQQLDKKN